MPTSAFVHASRVDPGYRHADGDTLAVLLVKSCVHSCRPFVGSNEAVEEIMSALTYISVWKCISARIHGLERAAATHARFLAANNKSSYGAEKELQRQCADILVSIESFQQDYESLLPVTATLAIDAFKDDAGRQIKENSVADALLVRTIIVKLIAFEAELTYLLSNHTEQLRSASELAFLHLQRQIVADEDYRSKWQKAHSHHETACEKLGSVHLLWHGIWAFKVSATAGGQTDLVYQEPLRIDAAPLSLGFVLTEWKRVTAGNADSAYREAKAQAEIYRGGILGGLELTSHRYLVVVTKEQINVPEDIRESNIVYRHINIAVDPQLPSAASKKLSK